MTKTAQALIERANENNNRGVVYHGIEAGTRGGRKAFGVREIDTLNKMEASGIVKIFERRSSFDSKAGNGSWTYTSVYSLTKQGA